MQELADLEMTLGYHFGDRTLLEQALTHGSVRHEQQTSDTGLPVIEDNERLEFLGDAIVGLVIAELLYRRYPELHEGELTRLRAALVSRKHLGLVGIGLQLGNYLRLGRAEERNGGRRKAVLLANCMEALIGAVYLEGGFAAAASFVERSVAAPFVQSLRDELREHSAIGDYKTALQELLQARRAGQPEYVILSESGPDHRKRFLVEARISSGGLQSAQAESSTKKKAEQDAARLLYEQLTSLARADGGSHERLSDPRETLAASAPSIEKHPSIAVSSPASAKSSPGLGAKTAKKRQTPGSASRTTSASPADVDSLVLAKGSSKRASQAQHRHPARRTLLDRPGAGRVEEAGDRNTGK